MAPPRRTAAWGTKESLLEDLRLIRDAGGVAQAGVARLEASLRLRFETAEPTPAQVAEVREWLRRHVRQAIDAYRVLHLGEVCAQAAADSAQQILLAEPDERVTAAAHRRAALERHGCHIAADSLRKRELDVLQLIADAAFADTATDEGELFVNIDAMLRILRPYAELAALNVADAAKKFAQRAALTDDTVLGRAVAHAMWAVAMLGVLPVYGLDRMRVLGIRDVADQTIEQMLADIIRIPFLADPQDLYRLATAARGGEDAEAFYARLYITPVMRPVLDRFVVWIAGHDPEVCRYDGNDVMIGYCGPHYYSVLCECLVEAQEDWSSGEYAREITGLYAALSIGDRGS